MSDDDTILALRRTELGLASTLAPNATITPRTLAMSSAPPGEPAPIELPKISIDGRGAQLGESAQASPNRDYAIVSTLGEGGMGRVQLARQRSLDREVALKTLKPDASHAAFLALIEEARIAGALEHPGVIPIHALGVDEHGRPMLVMKRIDGVDFGALLADPSHRAWQARGRSDDRLVASLEILTQVCHTLEFAHSRGVLHRDVKPENIMVGSFGEVYLLDWGIATSKDRAGDGRTLVGTPTYMAPEMVRGDAIDERTDVYLLGATLHEILVGRPRHDGDTIMAVLMKALASEPYAYAAGIPERLAGLANRATARDPAARPPSVQAFREEIGDYLRLRSVRAIRDAALASLGSLETMLAEPGVPKDLRAAYRLATEARFGLAQSLRAHPDDADGKDGMRRCIRASIELELRQGHADSAEALLGELDVPDDDLTQRIRDVRVRAAAAERERARLEHLDRDLDPGEQAGRRLLPTLGLAVLGLAIGIYAIWTMHGVPGPRATVTFALIMLVVAAVGFGVLRRRILTNAFNRRLAALVLVALTAELANRVMGLVTGTPVQLTLAGDLFAMGIVCAVGAVAITRSLGWAAALATTASVAARLAPESTGPIFAVASVGTLVVAAVMLPRHR